LADFIRIGTRGSLLAKTQASVIKDALVAKGHPAELVIIVTDGDKSSDPIASIGVGVFTAALREAIADAGSISPSTRTRICRPLRIRGSRSPRYPRERTPATRLWPATDWFSENCLQAR